MCQIDSVSLRDSSIWATWEELMAERRPLKSAPVWPGT
jgi:hypothetical protein